MENWGIDLAKQAFKFSAAHFLIFPDGTCERLHGHNYRVFTEVDAGITEYGLVIDFKKIKPIVKRLVDELDEHLLLPGGHPELMAAERDDGVTEIHYLDRYYAAPTEDVIVLPINNTSSENLACFLGRRLMDELQQQFPSVILDRVRMAVEETSGQRGRWEWTQPPE
ncbi:6-pyruvoyl tetrahydropterin synthase [Candidatus Woesearchaeota archaeon]|jgi:6-pyruvoyltetrahydropterin/6-carboxytetrahydropterin synthase|nr:6-pyruvoyl tetrahydropterin synthase [Candidatus Woesearchaeota archaeon]MDP6741169.1 6-carboxytetrahydropterin synthase [Planctomycetota bacterium]MDP6938900.1 6-carboxytetrahydropterin synthase [Planctomycetota bacterium]